jgi:hypothetical protein
VILKCTTEARRTQSSTRTTGDETTDSHRFTQMALVSICVNLCESVVPFLFLSIMPTAKFRCAVQHASLTAHQQGANSVPLDRRKDFVYRVRDQASPLTTSTLPTALLIPANAPSASLSTTRPLPHLPVPQRKSSCDILKSPFSRPRQRCLYREGASGTSEFLSVLVTPQSRGASGRKGCASLVSTEARRTRSFTEKTRDLRTTMAKFLALLARFLGVFVSWW